MTLEEYNNNLENSIQDLLEKSKEAKKDSSDVEQDVGVGFAKDMAGRCEKLLGIDGLAEAIRELEEQGVDREQIAFKIAEKFANGELGDYEDQGDKVEAAIRSSIALLTQGVVAAPIEGIGDVTVDEGYIRIPYNGPIRSAGGTGQVLSVLVAEYVRQILEIPKFEATKEEVERYVEEVRLYDNEQSMQYLPSREEIEAIIENTPIMLDGDPTTDNEVEGYRNLKRINTNRGRGGMCLVVAEGMALKAPKIQKFVEEFNLEGWEWISKLMDEEDQEEEENQKTEKTTEVKRRRQPKENWKEEFPKNKKYIKKLPAGRPMFSEPNKGLRLRYGKSRNIGLASAGIHPATMHITHDFLANSTQLKSERPGKALGVSAVTSIDGPTIKTKNGDIQQINDKEEAKQLVENDNIEKIIDLGEILICYGEFLENNHDLPPSSYTREWWIQDVKKTKQNPEQLEKLNIEEYLQKAKQHNIPLHPQYTPFWTRLNHEELKTLKNNIKFKEKEAEINKKHSQIIEKLLIPAKKQNNYLKIQNPHKTVLERSIPNKINQNQPIREQITEQLGIEVMQRETIRIGTRMGRPEQAKKREMNPSVHGLYPISEAGGDTRNIIKASKNPQDSNRTLGNNKNKNQEENKLSQGEANVKVNNRKCTNCQKQTYRLTCQDCGNRTKQQYQCYNCDHKTTVKPEDPQCPQCKKGTLQPDQKTNINITKDYQKAKENLGIPNKKYSKIKGVKKLMSKNKTPEPLEKAILRQKHNVSTFRDGTCRFDIMDLPLTTFKPKEIGITVKQAKKLGYKQDINGNKLENPEQLLEIYPQDVIISKDGAKYLHKVANYIDDLLENYYNQQPHYNADKPEDLIGHKILGLAPHTSAALVGRIIGFTDSAANYASPFWHAGKRRNCFHPNTTLNYRINGEWKESTIEELVETHITEEADDSYATGEKVQSIDEHPDIDEIKVPSMNDNEQRTIEEVSHLSKHPAPEELIKIEFNDETELKVTPEHKIPVRTQEGIEEKPALSIEEGDKCFDYNEEILEKVKGFKQFDLIEEILEKEELLEDKYEKTLRDIMIRGMKKEEIYDLFIDELKPKWEGQFYKMKSTCEYLDITKKQLDNHLRQESIPLSWLYKIYEEDKDKIKKELPKDIKIGVRRDNVKNFRQVELDEELACLLGYYTAEGFARFNQKDRRTDNKTGVRQVDIAATESEARDFIEETLRKKFNIKNVYKGNKRLTASGFIVTFFFNEIVSSGNTAGEKRVPEIIKDSNERIKKSYLSGYISGDGYMSNRSIRMVTISEQLRDDVMSLADTLGYKTTYQSINPIPLKEKFPDYYDDSEEKMSKKTYKIRLSNHSSTLFVQDYGIHLERKEETERKREIKSVEKVSMVGSNVDATYDLTITNTHKLEANITLSNNCDGDQDSIMLLMDGLLNFSEEYLPDIRGQRSVTGDTIVFVRGDGDGFRGVKIGELVDGLFEENQESVREYSSDSEFWKDEFNGGVDEVEVSEDEEFNLGSEVGEKGPLGDNVDETDSVDEDSEEVDEESDKDELDELLDDVDSVLEDIESSDDSDDNDFVSDGGVDEVGLEVLDVSGLETLSFDHSGEVDFGEVDKVIRHEVDDKRVFDVGFGGGSVSMTEDHGVFVTDGVRVWEKDVCSLEVGDFVVSSGDLSGLDIGNSPGVIDLRLFFDDLNSEFEGYFDSVLDVDEDLLRLLGFWFKDGFVSEDSKCGFIEVDDREQGRRVMDLVSSVFGVDSWLRSLNSGKLVVGVPLVFEELFDGVPSVVYGVDDVLKEAFLESVFDGDVSVGSECVVGDSGVAGEVGLLCRLVGYNSSCVSVDSGWCVKVENWNDYWVSPLDRDDFVECLENVPDYVRERIWSNLEVGDGSVLSKEEVELLGDLDSEFRNEGVDGDIDVGRFGVSLGRSNINLASNGNLTVERVEYVEEIDYDGYVYDLSVPRGQNFLCGPGLIFAHNTMDAPLVVTTKMDPEEVDDEVYNVDIAGEYPLEFFEKTQSCPDPKDVDISVAEDIKESGYGFRNNVETETFDAGPNRSVYATIEGMEEKVEAQMELASLIEGVDEAKVAEIVLGSHFIPDIMGNLSSFTSQEFQCVKCYSKYRRPPLNGICSNCGYELNLTLYEGSVKKYLDIMDRIVEKYDLADYTEQRIKFINSRIEGVFDSDLEEQAGLDDFL